MSIQLELKVTAGKPIYRGHDHYWSVIRDLGKNAHFTKHEIAQRSNDPTDKCIDDFLGRLKKAGYVETVESTFGPTAKNGRARRDVYRLVKRPAATPIINRDGSVGQQGLGQLHMWNTMRALGGFNKHELAVASTTDEVSVSVETASRYARLLEDAGYLQVLRPGGAGVARIWRLKPSMNTGPNAPKILKSKIVYDANLQEVMGTPIAEECAA
jgi:ribosomal protein S8